MRSPDIRHISAFRPMDIRFTSDEFPFCLEFFARKFACNE